MSYLQIYVNSQTNAWIQYSSSITKINTYLDPNKAQGHDMLSIRMRKLCGNSIGKPVLLIFNDPLNDGKFTHEWKKANVALVRKKGNKQSLENLFTPYLQQKF